MRKLNITVYILNSLNHELSNKSYKEVKSKLIPIMIDLFIGDDIWNKENVLLAFTVANSWLNNEQLRIYSDDE